MLINSTSFEQIQIVKKFFLRTIFVADFHHAESVFTCSCFQVATWFRMTNLVSRSTWCTGSWTKSLFTTESCTGTWFQMSSKIVNTCLRILLICNLYSSVILRFMWLWVTFLLFCIYPREMPKKCFLFFFLLFFDKLNLFGKTLFTLLEIRMFKRISIRVRVTVSNFTFEFSLWPAIAIYLRLFFVWSLR